MEFLSPVHYGDHVDVDVIVEHVGTHVGADALRGLGGRPAGLQGAQHRGRGRHEDLPARPRCPTGCARASSARWSRYLDRSDRPVRSATDAVGALVLRALNGVFLGARGPTLAIKEGARPCARAFSDARPFSTQLPVPLRQTVPARVLVLVLVLVHVRCRSLSVLVLVSLWLFFGGERLPAMVGGMARLHGDERPAAGGAHLAAGRQRGLDHRAVLARLHHPRAQVHGLAAGRRAASASPRNSAVTVTGGLSATGAHHQVMGRRPVRSGSRAARR